MSAVIFAPFVGLYVLRESFTAPDAGAPADVLTLRLPFARYRIVGDNGLPPIGGMASCFYKDSGGTTVGNWDIWTGPGGTGTKLTSTPLSGAEVNSIHCPDFSEPNRIYVGPLYVRQTVNAASPATVRVVLVVQPMS